MTVLRSAVYNLYLFAMTFVLVLYGTVLRLLAPDRMLGVARLWARVMIGGARVLCGIRYSVTGLEHLPPGPVIVASRHQSAFDTLIWLVLLPRCCYVLKSELVRVPLFGPLIPPTGMIAVDRSAGPSAIRALLREGARAVRECRQIVIFPEGTRAPPDKMLPLQPGVAALAVSTGLPVIPVVTDSGWFWSRRAFLKRAGTIHVVMLPPLPPGLKREELMHRLKEAFLTPVGGNQPHVPA